MAAKTQTQCIGSIEAAVYHSQLKLQTVQRCPGDGLVQDVRCKLGLCTLRGTNKWLGQFTITLVAHRLKTAENNRTKVLWDFKF